VLVCQDTIYTICGVWGILGTDCRARDRRRVGREGSGRGVRTPHFYYNHNIQCLIIKCLIFKRSEKFFLILKINIKFLVCKICKPLQIVHYNDLYKYYNHNRNDTYYFFYYDTFIFLQDNLNTWLYGNGVPVELLNHNHG